MADTVLLLGGISFERFEIPEKILYGGTHRIAEHWLIGGDVIIDAMGPRQHPVRWSGRFRGANAESRARGVEQLLNSGREITLSWGGIWRRVVVTEFEPQWERFYEIPYSITCTVSRNPVGGGGIAASIQSIISGDLGALQSLGAGL